jgi:pimeloyl-ACP methyl ester carboxylesterase
MAFNLTDTNGDVMLRGFVDTSLGQIHYREMGTGAPLILLHQTAESGRMYTEVMPLFAKQFHVLAPDTLGYGDSDRPAAPLSMAEYGRSIVEFMDALGIEKANIVGIHTGAAMGVEIASAYPDRVSKLVLCGCPDYDPDVRPGRAAMVKPLTVDVSGEHFTQAWARVAMQMKGWASPEQMHRSAVDILKARGTDHFATLAVLAHDVRDGIPKITAPTLLATGAGDMFAARQAQIAPLFRNAESYIFESASGLPMIERPEAFVAVVDNFLSKAA